MNLTSMINRALDVGIASLRNYTVNPLWGRRISTPTLLTASQTLVVIAADAAPLRQPLTAVGPELSTEGYTRITLWGQLDIGVMTGIRFACYGRHTSGGFNHSPPIYNPSVAALPYQALWAKEELVFADNGFDVNFALTWDLGNTFPYVQFGCGATADPGGGDDAVITNVYYTLGWGS